MQPFVNQINPTGSTTGQVPVSNGSVVSWQTPSSGVTDLTYIPSDVNGVVTSSTGTDATIPLVDDSNAGLMSPDQKDQLDTAADISSSSYAAYPTQGILSLTSQNMSNNDIPIPLVDGTNAGLMSPAQRTKLINDVSSFNVESSGTNAEPVAVGAQGGYALVGYNGWNSTPNDPFQVNSYYKVGGAWQYDANLFSMPKFVGAGGGGNGNQGLVPQPLNGDQTKFLCGNGLWETVSVPTVTKYKASIGDGSALDLIVTHNLGTLDVGVHLFKNSSGQSYIPDVISRTTNSVTIRFSTAPASNEFRVLCESF